MNWKKKEATKRGRKRKEGNYNKKKQKRRISSFFHLFFSASAFVDEFCPFPRINSHSKHRNYIFQESNVVLLFPFFSPSQNVGNWWKNRSANLPRHLRPINSESAKIGKRKKEKKQKKKTEEKKTKERKTQRRTFPKEKKDKKIKMLTCTFFSFSLTGKRLPKAALWICFCVRNVIVIIIVRTIKTTIFFLPLRHQPSFRL